MAASLKYYKDQIESAIADAYSNGYAVEIENSCCGCSKTSLEIWERSDYSGTAEVIKTDG